MICPNCIEEIPENSKECPECGEALGENEEPEKADKRKEFTHYKIVLQNAGTRACTINILSEITGLNEKKVLERIQKTPWTIVTGISLNEAQEIKILLETNKAIVRLEGVDLWEEENTARKNIEDSEISRKKKRFSKKQVVILLTVLIVFITGSVFLLSLMESFQGKGLVQFGDVKIKEPGLPPGSKNIESAGTAQSEKDEKKHTILQIRNEGVDSEIPEIAVRFIIEEETLITISIYDLSMSYIGTLLDGNLKADKYRLTWNGMADTEKRVSPGMYFLLFETSDIKHFHKIVWPAR